jgi:hypothetical protein
MSKYETLARIAIAGYESHKDDPEALKFFTGLVAEGLHRTPAIHTGLISEKAAKRAKGVKFTKEHFFGRQASAEKIIELIAQGKSFNRIVAVIKSRSRVHYTTPKENTYLKKYGNLFWRDAYAALGIKLVPYVKRNKKYVYIIEGTVYNNAKQVAEKYKLSVAGIDYRCRSPKFEEWIRERIS